MLGGRVVYDTIGPLNAIFLAKTFLSKICVGERIASSTRVRRPTDCVVTLTARQTRLQRTTPFLGEDFIGEDCRWRKDCVVTVTVRQTRLRRTTPFFGEDFLGEDCCWRKDCVVDKSSSANGLRRHPDRKANKIATLNVISWRRFSCRRLLLAKGLPRRQEFVGDRIASLP